MASHEERLVQFLLRPTSYPHATGPIGHRETHVSHVFLAGEFAYKLKKPVTFPFLDASTLARRKRFCELELSLNRRLAPTVYLDIVPVINTPRGLRLGGRERVIEWLVKMRRLPEDRMLDQLVAHRRISARDMVRVADRLIPFFQRAARNARIDRVGMPEHVRALVLGNLQECSPFIGHMVSQAESRVLEAAYRQYLALYEPVLRQRVRERRIIDGHGDLRCENICMTDPVNIFDCVEFQPAFRCGDMANDLSFLAMDLEFRDHQDLANAVVARYRQRIVDRTLEVVLPFYKCHRSLVRGKVRAFAWQQHPHVREGRRARTLSRRHFQLALEYARAFAPPRLVVIGGVIGTGKSTLAKALAEALGAAWLRTDEIRLREFARYRRSQQGMDEGLYAPRVSVLVYQRLIQRAETLVRQGHSVVCDGTFSHASGRNALRDIARRRGTSFHFIECVVPKAVALRRVAARHAARSDLSEARPEHYDRMKADFEPVQGWSAREWTRLSDHRRAEKTFQAALHALRRAWGLPV